MTYSSMTDEILLLEIGIHYGDNGQVGELASRFAEKCAEIEGLNATITHNAEQATKDLLMVGEKTLSLRSELEKVRGELNDTLVRRAGDWSHCQEQISSLRRDLSEAYEAIRGHWIDDSKYVSYCRFCHSAVGLQSDPMYCVHKPTCIVLTAQKARDGE
jgi:hypothetical protein